MQFNKQNQPQDLDSHRELANPDHQALDQVMETTDIYRFPQSQSEPYKTIFVCCFCLTKWRSPCGTGSSPYVSRLGFQFFCVNVFCYFFVPCAIREFKSPAQHISGRSAGPGLGQTGRNPDAHDATPGNGPVGWCMRMAHVFLDAPSLRTVVCAWQVLDAFIGLLWHCLQIHGSMEPLEGFSADHWGNGFTCMALSELLLVILLDAYHRDRRFVQ